jgi:acetyltransferase-like isoleucine patch superfamily enzyme
MEFIYRAIMYLNTIPARLKGMKIGKGSALGPGYDFLFVKLNNIILKDNVLIGRNAWLENVKDDASIIIENNSNIGRSVTISCASKIKIGRKCLLSYNVTILDHDHNFNGLDLFTSGITKGTQILIDEGCFIGAHSFILKGVHLGKNCVVGANSVVTKSFPDNSIIAGNPAKLIKKRNFK